MRIPSEPEVADDPVNEMLDHVEAEVRAIIECGAEAPLRARLLRLMPPAALNGAAVPPTPSSQGPVPPCGREGSAPPGELSPAVKLFAALYAKTSNGAQAFADAFPDTVADATRRSERARLLLRRPAVAALVEQFGGDASPKVSGSRRRETAIDVADMGSADLVRLARILAAAAGTLPIRVTIEVAPAALGDPEASA